jgi:prolyl oligopeptidase
MNLNGDTRAVYKRRRANLPEVWLRRLVLSRATLRFTACVAALVLLGADGSYSYPTAERESTTNSYYGVPVTDPYQWLEDLDTVRTRTWLESETALTNSYFSGREDRSEIKNAAIALENTSFKGTPVHYGSRWFYDGSGPNQDSDVVYEGSTDHGPWSVLVDFNDLPAGEHVSSTTISFDGRSYAYATQSSGSDWKTWHFIDVTSRRHLSDVLHWSKYGSAAFEFDSGFYYSGYDEPSTLALAAPLGVQKVFFHRLGTKQDEDQIVYDTKDQPGFASGHVTFDQTYVWVRFNSGGTAVFWKRTGTPSTGLRILVPHVVASVEPIGNERSRFYLLTNLSAPRRRIVWVDAEDPAHVLHHVVDESSDELHAASLLRHKLYLTYLHNGYTRIQVRSLEGRIIANVKLPGIGTASSIHGNPSDRFDYYSWGSYTAPFRDYKYDTETNRSEPAGYQSLAFDSSPFISEQWWATSKDGTRIPFFITHRRGLTLDGKTPTLLTGYGGFDVPVRPEFSTESALWCQMGGAYAQAILRGDGDFGEEWHLAGTRTGKQHVFDDFIAVAQELATRRVTSPQKLAISGASNGGLLVAAALTQRPELFGAAVIDSAPLDMLRYQRFGAGAAWRSEFGASDQSRSDFLNLYAYSPYQNIRPDASYPAVLVLVADHDDRVFPGNSYKFVAALQHAQVGPAPILLRIEGNAGHAGVSGSEASTTEDAEIYSFLAASLGFRAAVEKPVPSTTSK